MAVVGVALADVGGLVVAEVEEPDLGSHAAPVALPGAEITADRHVGDGAAVGGDRAELAVRDRQPLRQTARGRDPQELAVPHLLGLHEAGNQDRFAVGIPVEHAIRQRVVRDALHLATGRRHDIDIDVAVVVGLEGDAVAVGREAGEPLLAGGRAQPRGYPAGLGNDPDIAGVHEGDMGVGDVGVTQHPRIDLGRGGC